MKATRNSKGCLFIDVPDIPSDIPPVFAVYYTVLLFSACITEKELLNAGVALSTQGPYLAPGLEDLLVDLYVITALGFGD